MLRAMNQAARRLAPFLFALFAGFTQTSMARNSLLYIATQNPDQMGITVAQFDPDTGALAAPKPVIATRDPAHFTLSAEPFPGRYFDVPVK